MTRTLNDIAEELLCCAEALSEAVGRRELSAVESLLAQRLQLLGEMRCIEIPGDEDAQHAIERVREHDRRTGAGLRAMRGDVAQELGRVRSARRSASETHERSRPSHFVSTRC